MNFNFKSLHELNDYFKDEETCYRFLEQQWWGENQFCPHCGSLKKPYIVKSRIRFKDIPSYRCSEPACGLPFTIRTNSIFEGSKVELKKWFHAIYEIVIAKKGISSIQLSEKINVSQKTAWLMMHKIRTMLQEEDPYMMEGTTQVDETFLGGKNKNRHQDKKVKNSQGRAYIDKTPVLGMVNHDTNKVRLFVIPDTSQATIMPILYRNIKRGSTVYTDEWWAYRHAYLTYNHFIVDHGRGQYTDGDVTTNKIENFWSIFKRGIIGVYQSVSRKHLQRYCNEFAMRFNHRLTQVCERFVYAVKCLTGKRFTYFELTKNI